MMIMVHEMIEEDNLGLERARENAREEAMREVERTLDRDLENESYSSSDDGHLFDSEDESTEPTDTESMSEGASTGTVELMSPRPMCYRCEDRGHRKHSHHEVDQTGNTWSCPEGSHRTLVCPSKLPQDLDDREALRRQAEAAHALELVTRGIEQMEKSSDSDEEDDLCLLSAAPISEMTPHTFIADSGASSHMEPSCLGMVDPQPSTYTVKFGTGEAQPVSKVGNRKGQVMQSDGSSTPLTMRTFKCVPNLWTNR